MSFLTISLGMSPFGSLYFTFGWQYVLLDVFRHQFYFVIYLILSLGSRFGSGWILSCLSHVDYSLLVMSMQRPSLIHRFVRRLRCRLVRRFGVSIDLGRFTVTGFDWCTCGVLDFTEFAVRLFIGLDAVHINQDRFRVISITFMLHFYCDWTSEWRCLPRTCCPRRCGTSRRLLSEAFLSIYSFWFAAKRKSIWRRCYRA